MVKSVLVTGAQGFIGKNLISSLNDRGGVTVLEFGRQDDDKTLFECLGLSEYVVHLAGEVRPSSSDAVFHASNVSLTEKIINHLKAKGLNTPILLASSVHAELLKNEYGRTKRTAELLIESYIQNTGSDSHVFRLPHVFGQGCKPNYNSVVTTWICNILKGEDIVIYDREIKMEYVYVQDIVSEFIHLIFESRDSVYVSPLMPYATTLGEVAKCLESFHAGDQRLTSTFQEKLYETFLSYKREIYG